MPYSYDSYSKGLSKSCYRPMWLFIIKSDKTVSTFTVSTPTPRHPDGYFRRCMPVWQDESIQKMLEGKYAEMVGCVWPLIVFECGHHVCASLFCLYVALPKMYVMLLTTIAKQSLSSIRHYLPCWMHRCVYGYALHHPPFCYISGSLEESSVVVLLQALFGLRDQGAGALQTLPTVCNLLSQLAQFHDLKNTQIRTHMLLCHRTRVYIICLTSDLKKHIKFSLNRSLDFTSENRLNMIIYPAKSNAAITFRYGAWILSNIPFFITTSKVQTRLLLWCYWSFMLISCSWK